MDRRDALLRMGELLEHVRACHESLEEAEPRQAARLAETIERDLANLRSLCKTLGRGVAEPTAGGQQAA